MRAIFQTGIAWAVACLALGAAVATAADPIADSGMSADEIRSQLVESVGQGMPALPFGLRKLGPAARADFVRAAGALAFDYYKTADFRSRYAAWRDARAPKLEPLTTDEMNARNARAQQDFAKGEADQKNMVGNLEAQRAAFKQAGMTDAQIDQIVAQMKAAQQQVAALRANGTIPSTPQLMTESQRQQENETRERDYRAAKEKFDREHPADPSETMRRKLGEFLELSATVDFDAKLEQGRFVDPAYEHKSDLWKRCFRAGKPAVEAARALAQEWLMAL